MTNNKQKIKYIEKYIIVSSKNNTDSLPLKILDFNKRNM